MKAKSISEITKIIGEFADKRGWRNDDPNQLITSLFIEISELAEHYQWKSKFPEFDEDQKRMVGYEFVDVIFYLFQLARKSGVDIEKYFEEKLPKLEAKYTVGSDYAKAHTEYRETGKNKLYE